jgi:DNA replication protein DnaD
VPAVNQSRKRRDKRRDKRKGKRKGKRKSKRKAETDPEYLSAAAMRVLALQASSIYFL